MISVQVNNRVAGLAKFKEGEWYTVVRENKFSYEVEGPTGLVTIVDQRSVLKIK